MVHGAFLMVEILRARKILLFLVQKKSQWRVFLFIYLFLNALFDSWKIPYLDTQQVRKQKLTFNWNSSYGPVNDKTASQ